MRIYHYICDKCSYEETLEQPVGSPRKHECFQEECDGTMSRVLGKIEETVFEANTPGIASQTHKENRSANETLTKIRAKAGGTPINDADHMAAERFAGIKNRIVPGSAGEQV